MGLLPAGVCCIKMMAPLSYENSLWSRPDLQALGILLLKTGLNIGINKPKGRAEACPFL